ncbi:MAG: carbohydrate ABC transporter permease [Clostridia bacterium]|nr:carbohydrate ABC transporter permease [Clostridia bacterium]
MIKKRKYEHMAKPSLQKRLKSFVTGAFRYLLIVCLSYLILAPILINLSTAFTNPRDLAFPSSMWIPARFSIENWHVSGLMLNYGKSLPYTLGFTAIICLLQTASAVMAGYTFARLKFPGRNILFALAIFTIVVPPQMFMLPQYLFFKEFDILGIFRAITGKPINLLGSSISLFILNAFGMGLKSGLYIYIFRQTFRALPKELEEAAYIDGAGFLRTFVSIVLPSAGAGILTVAVLSYVWSWNDPYYVQLFDNTNVNFLMLAFNKATGSVDEALASISSKVPVTYAFLLKNPVYESAIAKTAALLVFLPLVGLYMIVQRKFVQGVERSGIVG